VQILEECSTTVIDVVDVLTAGILKSDSAVISLDVRMCDMQCLRFISCLLAVLFVGIHVLDLFNSCTGLLSLAKGQFMT